MSRTRTQGVVGNACAVSSYNLASSRKYSDRSVIEVSMRSRKYSDRSEHARNSRRSEVRGKQSAFKVYNSQAIKKPTEIRNYTKNL